MYLKQWRTIGRRTFTLEEFRKVMDVPESYRPGSIDQKILNPTAEYLAPYFVKFRITKNYTKGIRGRKLISYTFTFKPNLKLKGMLGITRKLKKRYIYTL